VHEGSINGYGGDVATAKRSHTVLS
jgi:hypothetical protein